MDKYIRHNTLAFKIGHVEEIWLEDRGSLVGPQPCSNVVVMLILSRDVVNKFSTSKQRYWFQHWNINFKEGLINVMS